MDKLDILSNRLKDVSEKYFKLINDGMDEDIMIAYLVDKTKLSKTNIRLLLNKWEEFYDKLIKSKMLKELE